MSVKQQEGPGLNKPEKTYLSESEIQDYINNEISIAFDMGNQFIIEEAANVVYLIRNTVNSLIKEDYRKAIEHINEAKAKAILIDMGNNTKVISEINIAVNAEVKDAQSATKIIGTIDSLIQLGEMQKAKRFISQLSNDISITKESISIPHYVNVIETAEVNLKNKQYEEALLALNSVLGNVIIEQSIIPVPLIRAQMMVEEAENLISGTNFEQGKITTLLENTEYELKFSELLGYGKSENRYNDLVEKLEKLMENVHAKNIAQVKSQIKTLREDLKDFKNDISAYKTTSESLS
jgi:hypothetical protein